MKPNYKFHLFGLKGKHFLRKANNFLFFAFCVFCLSLPLNAQNERLYDQQLWLEGVVDYPFGKNVEFFADASYRYIFSTEENWWRVLARPSLKWKVLNWLDLRGGLGMSYSNLDNLDNIFEVRPWQGVAILWPKIKIVEFSHLFRAEQQIVYNTSTWKNIYSNRFRYQLGSRINLTKTKQSKYFFIRCSVEFFFRTNKELDKFLRNDGRYTIGLGYVFNPKITVEARCFVQRSRSDELHFNVSNEVFRLRFRYNILRQEEYVDF